MVEYLLMRLPLHLATRTWVSRLTLAGMLMPVGILAEVAFGLPPAFVLIGGVSMVVAIGWLGIAVARLKSWPGQLENVRV